MEASPPDSTETPDLVVNVLPSKKFDIQISTSQASKSKSSTVEGVGSQKPREGEILKGKLPVTASQVLPSAQESSPASEVTWQILSVFKFCSKYFLKFSS